MRSAEGNHDLERIRAHGVEWLTQPELDRLVDEVEQLRAERRAQEHILQAGSEQRKWLAERLNEAQKELQELRAMRGH